MNAKVNESSWIWHNRLGHASMDSLARLINLDLVRGLPKMNFENDRICKACQLGIQTKSSFKPKNIVSTSRPLELLHMDLFGPISTTSLGEKRYGFVIIDDYSRFTWILFIAHKDEAFDMFVSLFKKIN